MRTMIAIPCMDMLHADFFRSCVGLEVSGEVQWTTAQNSLIYDSRNKLAEIAIDGDFDRILWLDSDMIFDRYLFRRLSEHLDQGREMISGLYFSRKPPVHPVIYSRLRRDPIPTGGYAAAADSFDDYDRDSLFEIAGCGFGAVMMTVDLIRQIRDRYGPPFSPTLGFGEDLAFCLRAAWLEKTIWCDSSIKLGHVGTTVYDETLWRQLQGITD